MQIVFQKDILQVFSQQQWKNPSMLNRRSGGGLIWTDDVTVTYMALHQRSLSGYIPYELAN